MADRMTDPDQNSSFEEKIAHLRQNNVSDDQIASHLSTVNDPSAQEWVRQYKLDQVEKAGKAKTGDNSNVPANITTPPSSNIGGVNTSGFKGIANTVNDAANWYAGLTTPEKLGYPVGAYLGVKAVNLGFRTLEDKVKAQTEINKQKQILALKNPATATTAVPTTAPTTTSSAEPIGQITPEPQNRYWDNVTGTTSEPMPLEELKARVENLGKTSEGTVGQTTAVETTEPPKLSEWAKGAQPTAETGTSTGMTAEPTVTPDVPSIAPSAAEQAAIEKLTATTPAATEVIPAETNAPAPAPKEANAAVVPTEEQKATAEKAAKEKLTWPGLAEEKGPMRWMANTIGTVKDVKGSQAAFEMAKDKLEALGVDLSPVHPESGKKVGGGLIPEGHAVLNDFYKTYTGEDLPKGGKILTEQKMKLYDALKTHLEEAHANGNLKKLGNGAIAAAAVLGISSAVQAAMNGDTSKLIEAGFDLGVSAIPGVGTAAAALTGTTLSPATLRSDAFAEVLNRPDVRQTLKTMQQTLSPADYNKARDKYLEKASTFSQYASNRFAKPNILGAAPVNRNTLLPVAPPR